MHTSLPPYHPTTLPPRHPYHQEDDNRLAGDVAEDITMEAACGISGASDGMRQEAEECSHAAASNEFLASSLEDIWLDDEPNASDSIGGKVLDAHQTAKPLSDRADQLRDAARVVDANGFQNIPPYLYLLQERALAEFQQQGGVAELQQQSGVPMLTRRGKARAAAAGEQTTLLEGHFID